MSNFSEEVIVMFNRWESKSRANEMCYQISWVSKKFPLPWLEIKSITNTQSLLRVVEIGQRAEQRIVVTHSIEKVRVKTGQEQVSIPMIR